MIEHDEHVGQSWRRSRSSEPPATRLWFDGQGQRAALLARTTSRLAGSGSTPTSIPFAATRDSRSSSPGS